MSIIFDLTMYAPYDTITHDGLIGNVCVSAFRDDEEIDVSTRRFARIGRDLFNLQLEVDRIFFSDLRIDLEMMWLYKQGYETVKRIHTFKQLDFTPMEIPGLVRTPTSI